MRGICNKHGKDNKWSKELQVYNLKKKTTCEIQADMEEKVSEGLKSESVDWT
jgi:hypothetical protein